MENQQNTSKLTSVLKLFGIGAVIIAIFAGLIWIGETQDKHTATPSPLSGEVTATDHTEGPSDAKLTLVEYADFQCPSCAAFSPVVTQLHDSYATNLRIVYRYFPLQTIHPNATIAAQAAEAADKQGKFWEMHDILFSKQNDWNKLPDPKDMFASYAEQLGLNVDQFKTDMVSQETKDRVNADVRSGNAAGVDSTPTFYLNGEVLDTPRGLDAFKDVIDAKLAE